MRSRLLRLGVVLLLLAIAIGGWLFWSTSRVGEGAVEAAVRRLVVSLTDQHLEPDFHFGTLDYQYPRRVVIQDVSLDKEGESIVSAAELVIDLAEIPRRHQPIRFQGIELREPELRLLIKPDSEGGGLKGFSPFLKPRPQETDGEVPQDEGAEDGEPVKLSEVFEIRRLVLRDGRIDYRPAGGETIVLDNIDVDTTIEPVDEAGETWYRMAMSSVREPGLSLSTRGRLNLDRSLVRLNEIELSLDAAEARQSPLPPSLKDVIERHNVSGQLNLTGDGEVPLQSPGDSTAAIEISLEDGAFAFDRYEIDLDRFTAKAAYEDGTFAVAPIHASLLGGEVRASVHTGDQQREAVRVQPVDPESGTAFEQQREAPGHAPETHGEEGDEIPGAQGGKQVTAQSAVVEVVEAEDLSVKPAQTLAANLTVKGVDLERLNRPDNEEPIAGVIDADVRFAAPLDALTQKSRGHGDLVLTGGRFLRLPVVSALSQALDRPPKADDGSGEERPKGDQVRLRFRFVDHYVAFESIEVIGSWFLLRGKGEIDYAGQTDLRLNGGPLEKLQSKLGVVGDIFGKITDQLTTYRVRGPIGSPEVKVEPGSFGKSEIATKTEEKEQQQSEETEQKAEEQEVQDAQTDETEAKAVAEAETVEDVETVDNSETVRDAQSEPEPVEREQK